MIRLFHAQNKASGSSELTGDQFVIFAGQSNMGRCTVSQMTSGEAALYDVNFPNTLILRSGSFEQINPGTNTLLGNPQNADEFGPEVSFSKTFQDRYNRELFINKCARGSTSLAVDWSPTGTDWNNLTTTMTQAVQAGLLLGKNLKLAGFVWMQGENDATNATWAANYLTNLVNFFDDVKAHWASLVSTYSLGVPTDFPKIIGRINGATDPSQVYRADVRAAQATFCADGGNLATLIDTDGYPIFDGVHYSASGQIEFGIDIINTLYGV